MVLKLSKTKKGEAVMTKEVKNAGEVISEEASTEVVAAPAGSAVAQGTSLPMCEVGVDASFTANLGNYQSAKMGVSLKIPCVHADINETFDYAKAWVDAKLTGMVAEMTSDGNPADDI